MGKWFTPNIAVNAILWIVALALQIGGWVNRTFAITLLCLAFVWSVGSVIYWIKKGSRMDSWIHRIRFQLPMRMERKASQPVVETLSQEQVVERLSFIQQLRAVSERLFKNSQGADSYSIYSIVRDLRHESPVREYIAKDSLADQALRLLMHELDELFGRASSYQRRAEGLTTASLDDANVGSICNTTRELVLYYRRLVDEAREILKNLESRGVETFWYRAPWSVRINRGLADNYDDLMRLVADLRGKCSRAYKDVLPSDDQLSKFPRASLLS